MGSLCGGSYVDVRRWRIVLIGTHNKRLHNTQGAILLYAKEAIANSMLAAGVGPTLTG